MTDILYLGYNRFEFTQKTFETMLRNTNWSKVNRLVVYDDGSRDGTREYLETAVKASPVAATFITTREIGPVGVMVDYLGSNHGDRVFAKIDNDVMLPPAWLDEGLEILGQDPSIDLLGIEAILPPGPGPRSFAPAAHIGGIGFMRSRAFQCCIPIPRGRFGFTAWQTSHEHIVKGWINPGLSVCLLNLVPFEPWATLSRKYVRSGWQREWPPAYSPESTDLWDWWMQ